MYYYNKSLYIIIPFPLAYKSILIIFNLILASSILSHYSLLLLVHAIIIAQRLLFKEKNINNFEPIIIRFIELLEDQINKIAIKFLVLSY